MGKRHRNSFEKVNLHDFCKLAKQAENSAYCKLLARILTQSSSHGLAHPNKTEHKISAGSDSLKLLTKLKRSYLESTKVAKITLVCKNHPLNQINIMSKKANNIDPQLSSASEVSFHHMANQESRFNPGRGNGQGC